MKIRRIPMIAKWWLAVILVLALLPWTAIARAESKLTLDEQLIAQAARGDLPLIKSLRHECAAVNYPESVTFAEGCKKSEQKRPTIDLFDLLSLFMIPDSEPGDLKAWATGAQPSSPIEWKTDGIKPHPSSKGDARQGQAVVTINGKPLYVLRKYVTPAPWQIWLIGSRQGIRQVDISPLAPGGTVDLERQLRKRNISFELYKCNVATLVSGEVKIYAIKAPNKKRAWLSYTISCGSADCMGSFTLFLTKEDADQVPDLVCDCAK